MIALVTVAPRSCTLGYDPGIDFETGLRMTIEAMDDTAAPAPREPPRTPKSTVF